MCTTTVFAKYLCSIVSVIADTLPAEIRVKSTFRVVQAVSKTENAYITFMKRYSFWIMIVLLITGLLSVYIEFFGYGLANLLIEGFDKLFKLVV